MRSCFAARRCWGVRKQNMDVHRRTIKVLDVFEMAFKADFCCVGHHQNDRVSDRCFGLCCHRNLQKMSRSSIMDDTYSYSFCVDHSFIYGPKGPENTQVATGLLQWGYSRTVDGPSEWPLKHCLHIVKRMGPQASQISSECSLNHRTHPNLECVHTCV